MYRGKNRQTNGQSSQLAMKDKYKLAFKSKFWNTVDLINRYIELNEAKAGISNHFKNSKKTLTVYHFLKRYLFC